MVMHNTTQRQPSYCDRLRQFVDHFNPGRFLLWKIIIIIELYTAGVCWIDVHGFPTTKVIEANAAISISAVLGILLIFRNNSAYERWWEARKLWGQLVNDSRNLAIKTRGYAEGLPEIERRELSQLISGFAVALKEQLRGRRDTETLAALSISTETDHPPSIIALEVYKRFKRWRKAGILDQWEQQQLDLHAKALMDVCGGTERILKSPIAGSYKLLLWLGLLLNAVLVPWFIVPLFHWWSIAIMLVSSYFVFGLELLAEEVERPFDDLPNDLPLDDICRTIKASVEECLEVAPTNPVPANVRKDY